MKLALFRADGSHRLGLGHIMRCLALAQGLGEIGVKPVFVIRDCEQSLIELIRRQGGDVETIPRDSSFTEDASLTLEFASRYNVNLIVTDLCHQEIMAHLEEYNRYLQALGTAHKFMITIDDLVKSSFPSDIKIIPYYGAENMSYESNNSTKLLLGPDYFIFRREFVEAAKVNRQIKKDAHNVLVTMGGSDMPNLTVKIVTGLTKLGKAANLNLRIVLGIAYTDSRKRELKEILRAVTGTPSIIISQTAYEAEKAKIFEKGGSAIHLGLVSQIDEADIAEAIEKLLDDNVLRAEMAKRGRDMVDGKGVRRVISEIPQEVLS